MTDRESFLAAITAAPDDDLPRLVYADWLDENGDPDRARFIRDQIALTKLRPGSYEYKATFRRTADTLRTNLPAWIQSACDAVGQPADWKPVRSPPPGLEVQFASSQRAALVRLEFHRGFVTSVHLDLGRSGVADEVMQLFRDHPITRLNLALPQTAHAVQLALPTSPLPVRSLRLWGAMNADTLDLTFSSPAFSRVVRLWVPAALAAERLVRSPMARRLTALRSSADIDLVAALHEYPLDDRLQEFSVQPIGSLPIPAVVRERFPNRPVVTATELWSALSRVAFRPTLKRLDLTRCGMSDDGLAAFARGEEWLRLQGLKLGGNQFGDRGWADFARGWRTPELTYLDASRNRLTDASAEALARSGMMRTLRTIDLRGCRIGGRGALALANAARNGPLRSLRLAGNPIRSKDVAQLRRVLGERVDVGGGG